MDPCESWRYGWQKEAVLLCSKPAIQESFSDHTLESLKSISQINGILGWFWQKEDFVACFILQKLQFGYQTLLQIEWDVWPWSNLSREPRRFPQVLWRNDFRRSPALTPVTSQCVSTLKTPTSEQHESLWVWVSSHENWAQTWFLFLSTGADFGREGRVCCHEDAWSQFSTPPLRLKLCDTSSIFLFGSFQRLLFLSEAVSTHLSLEEGGRWRSRDKNMYMRNEWVWGFLTDRYLVHTHRDCKPLWDLLGVGSSQAGAPGHAHHPPHGCRAVSLCLTDGCSSAGEHVLFQLLSLKNTQWTTRALFIPLFIHPGKSTAQKGQQGPADVRLLGYEQI